MINTKTGRMEEQSNVITILRKWIELLEKGETLKGKFIPKSKNHNGKPMMILSDDPGDDVSIYHLEISEEGIFPYIFDDGVS